MLEHERPEGWDNQEISGYPQTHRNCCKQDLKCQLFASFRIARLLCKSSSSAHELIGLVSPRPSQPEAYSGLGKPGKENFMERKKGLVIVLDRALVTSKAYLSLGGFAPQVLMLFYCRRRLEKLGRKGKRRWVCVNSNDIEFTYLEAKKRFGITNSRFTRAIDDLIAKGFIEIFHHGGCYQKDKTKYKLSERWRSFNTPEFSAVSRPKDPVKRGYRKPKASPLMKAESTLEKRAIAAGKIVAGSSATQSL